MQSGSSAVLIAMSQASDGSMSKAVSQAVRDENRRNYLAIQGIRRDETILVHLQYEGDNYCRYHVVTRDSAGDGIVRPPSLISDALFTQEKNLALLLPIADCIGAVVFDEANHVLGLAHLGRHNLLQNGGAKIIHYMEEQFGTHPESLQIWLSPAAGKENYPLYDFDNQGMHDVAYAQLLAAAVPARNIIRDERDTTMDSKLFSHSEFLKGNRQTDGRQAVVAMMR